MNDPLPRAFIPHVGWLRHEPGEEVISLLRQGHFEASEQAFCWLYLRPGDTVIDCGAHIGLYSVIADRATEGSARIFAVEPAAATADLLDANLRDNGVRGAHVLRSAIWVAPGTLRFITESDGRAAYAHVAFDDGGGGEAVAATTLDAIVSQAGAGRVALAKIDVEGAEPEALRGAGESIASGALPLLMVEFTEQNLQRRGLSTADLFAQLRALGYTMCEFDAASGALAEFVPDGPIWYRNLFACRDPAAVNARLRSSTPRNREVARDILGRAAACARFKELEELETYRNAGAEAESSRRWAQETEARLAEARRIEREHLAWAHQAEESLAQSRAAEAGNRAWAERTEAALAKERTTSAAHAEHIEALERALEPLSDFAQRHGWLYKLYLALRARRERRRRD